MSFAGVYPHYVKKAETKGWLIFDAEGVFFFGVEDDDVGVKVAII